MKAVILPTTKTEDLAPLTTWMPEFLLPVVNKPIVEHLIELLVRHDVRDITLIIKHMPYETEKYFGDGSRWGVRLSYALVGSYRSTLDALGRMEPSRLEGPFICLPADAVTDLDVSGFVAFQQQGQGGICLAYAGPAPEAPWRVPVEGLTAMETYPLIMTGEAFKSMTSGSPLPSAQADAVADGTVREECDVAVYRSSCRYEKVESLAGLASANRHALDGGFATILIPGKRVRDGVWSGRHCRIHRDVRLAEPLLLGDHCNIEAGASVGPGTIVGDRVIIDRGASVRDSVILSGTYVGAHAEVRDALVKKNWMFQTQRMLHVHLGDDLILGDLEKKTLAGKVGRLLNVVVASIALLATSPLWLALLIYHLLFPSKRFLRSRRLVRAGGARDLGGETAVRTFDLYFFESGSRFIRKIPGLLNVVKGDLSLVGVSALTEDEAARLPAEWREMRAAGPLGLFHLWELETRGDLEWEEKMVMESYYVASRSTWGDMKVFAKAFFAGGSR